MLSSNRNEKITYLSTYVLSHILDQRDPMMLKSKNLMRKDNQIFKTKMAFIPLNRSRHWSMFVLVNGDHLSAEKVNGEWKARNGINYMKGDHNDPFPFLFHFDSVPGFHGSKCVYQKLYEWINGLWKKEKGGSGEPFDQKSLVLVKNAKGEYELSESMK